MPRPCAADTGEQLARRPAAWKSCTSASRPACRSCSRPTRTGFPLRRSRRDDLAVVGQRGPPAPSRRRRRSPPRRPRRASGARTRRRDRRRGRAAPRRRSRPCRRRGSARPSCVGRRDDPVARHARARRRRSPAARRTRRLKSVDLPTFGRPTIATTGSPTSRSTPSRPPSQSPSSASRRGFSRPARLDADEELEEDPPAEERLELEPGPRADLAQALAAGCRSRCPCGSSRSTRIVAWMTTRSAPAARGTRRPRPRCRTAPPRSVWQEELLAHQLLGEEALGLGRELVLGIEARSLGQRARRPRRGRAGDVLAASARSRARRRARAAACRARPSAAAARAARTRSILFSDDDRRPPARRERRRSARDPPARDAGRRRRARGAPTSASPSACARDVDHAAVEQRARLRGCPGVSTKTTCASGSVRMPTMRFRVVCGFGRHDRDLRADERVQQRRLADVRPPDDGDVSGAVCHRLASSLPAQVSDHARRRRARSPRGRARAGRAGPARAGRGAGRRPARSPCRRRASRVGRSGSAPSAAASAARLAGRLAAAARAPARRRSVRGGRSPARRRGSAAAERPRKSKTFRQSATLTVHCPSATPSTSHAGSPSRQRLLDARHAARRAASVPCSTSHSPAHACSRRARVPGRGSRSRARSGPARRARRRARRRAARPSRSRGRTRAGGKPGAPGQRVAARSSTSRKTGARSPRACSPPRR